MTEFILQIDDALMARLRKQAEAQQRELQDVVIDAILTSDAMSTSELLADDTSRGSVIAEVDTILINRDFAAHMTDADPNNVFLRILEGAYEIGESSSESNIAERSREILHTEFPEYLMRRMRGQL
jgi:hypothetical protein